MGILAVDVRVGKLKCLYALGCYSTATLTEKSKDRLWQDGQ